jgi:excinuclease ABC subunit C
MSEKIKNKIKSLPNTPGVYIFKDKLGKIIYIGKAKALKKRVSSYFGRPQNEKNQVMVEKIVDLEYLLTPTDAQAQILEAALVKEKQPQYNIDLKDDKSFPLIKISNEEFPTVTICRRRKPVAEDAALYFGPYPNTQALRQAIKLIRRVFGFRSCKKIPKEACLYYRLKLCPAPCINKISPEGYAEIVRNIIMFLGSRYEELINSLSLKMKSQAAEKHFEEAARIRDQIDALSSIRQNRTYAAGLDELEDLKNLLRLDKLPERIEAFDISNISGTLATGSMVSFYRAKPDKNNYRRFRIKTVQGVDDFQMMSEVVQRRYRRLKEENASLPDLVLIDGGKAHLSVAEKEIKKLGLSIPLVSIAKDKENIYLADKKFPLRLKQDTPALNLIRRIRDEAHRFAISYHHLLRKKKVLGE